MGFVVDKRALEQVFLPVILFSSVSIIPLMLQTYLCLHVAVTRRRRDDWEHSKNNALMEIGEQWIEKKNSHLACKGINAVPDRDFKLCVKQTTTVDTTGLDLICNAANDFRQDTCCKSSSAYLPLAVTVANA